MRRFLLLFALAPLLASAAAAAPPRAPLPPPTPATWEIADPDTRITLFGTVHALPRGVDWFRPHIVAALDSADRLVLETLPPDGAAMQPLVARLARLPAPRPLVLRVPEPSRPALRGALDRLKPPPLDGWKTWYAALLLTNLQAEADGLDPRIGVEAVLAERARLRGRPIEGLETVEQQLIYFDALPEADQVRMLEATVDELPDSRARTTAMIGAWMTGDTAALAAEINAGFDRSPMLKQLLVNDRNERWAAWIAQRMQDTKGHLFIAVGAGHLAGPGNLIDRLTAYGIRATRTPAPAPVPPARKRRR